MSLGYEIKTKEWAIERNEAQTFNPEYIAGTVESIEKDIAEGQKELEVYRKMVAERVEWIKANVSKETEINIYKNSNTPTSYLVYRQERYKYPNGVTDWSQIWSTRKEFTGQTAQRDALRYVCEMMVQQKPDYMYNTNYTDKLIKLLEGRPDLVEFLKAEQDRMEKLRRS